MAMGNDYPVYHTPRSTSANTQDLMPVRYRIGIQLLSMAAFTLAFVGWLNETWLMWFENPIWLNRYTEYGIILGFGIWRIVAEKNSYTRKRLIILVGMVTAFWWLVPWLYPFYEPYVGYLWSQPVFPSLHVPGTVSFFLILGLVFLFGRRIICGFNCPCVGIRETVGFAFRDRTVRSSWGWALRHSKWFFFIYYVGVMVVTQFPPSSWTVSFVGGFYALVALTYFGSFYIAPLVGNRFYCRYLCPYGATFGLLNHAGFYRVKMDQDKCNDCQRCEQVCDMGIPVWTQGRASGQITGLEDCMGCARCVVSCPTDALEIRDVRNLFNKSLVQNASHLMKRKTVMPVVRVEAPSRPPEQRVQDWSEIMLSPTLAEIQAQASRCLDCGMPGCVNACPLQNRIPEWLEALAKGNIEQAAELAHSTSNFPEICGTLCPQHRLCEGACTKAREPGGAVTIGAAERFLVEEAFRRGWRPHQQDTPAKQYQQRSVAIIGAGPAGLTCADELSRVGVSVNVYDRLHDIGGLLASGVPSFKLDRNLLERRRQQLLQQGVSFHLGKQVYESGVQQLLLDHDALFLATGAQTSRDLKLPNQNLVGVTDAITYLAVVNRQMDGRQMDSRTLTNQEVLVIGGGDSAMDCARTAIRQGAAKVTLAYRGSEQAMRASPKEQKAARDEGIVFLFEHIPLHVIGKQQVTGVQFKTAGDEQALVSCDRLILAVGQVTQADDWMERLGISTDSVGAIHVDPHGRTRHPQIYAGGDNTLGPELVVTAISAGRRAAEAILKDFQPWRRWTPKFKTAFKPPHALTGPATAASETSSAAACESCR
jgi:glutamate synthase (NADPH/NADH) small chain